MYQSLQGNLGLSKAINYFISNGNCISIPLNDTQKYDLVAEINGKLNKISVKTSRQTNNNVSYSVQLRNTGGNKTGEIRQVPFDNQSCDYLFIYTENEKMYLIPTQEISAKNSICVGIKYSEFEVKIKDFSTFIQDNN